MRRNTAINRSAKVTDRSRRVSRNRAVVTPFPLSAEGLMGDWNLIVIGKVLGGLSITAAGLIMAATILGYTVPYGPFLILTCIILMLASAGLVIIRYQQCAKKAAPEP